MTRAVKSSAETKNKSEIDDQFYDDVSACKLRPKAASIHEDKEAAIYEDQFTITGPGKGKLLDRHFFSMLCYENFATFHHFLYFKSICKATYFAHRDDAGGIFPLNQGIIKQWCHEDNFCGRFLVSRYYVRQAISILLALAALRCSAFVLELLGRDLWWYDSFK